MKYNPKGKPSIDLSHFDSYKQVERSTKIRLSAESKLKYKPQDYSDCVYSKIGDSNFLINSSNGRYSLINAIVSICKLVDGVDNLIVSVPAVNLYDVKYLQKLKSQYNFNLQLIVIESYVSIQNYVIDYLNTAYKRQELSFSEMHSKVILFQSGDQFLTLKASANLTYNPRNEIYTLYKSKQVYDFHLKMLSELTND